jgi:predicted regulator of Ras-like GTPase activity (Roadblock/LC7/MglB family)
MKSIQQIIETLGQEEGFSTVVLTNESGLPLAMSENREESEALAAVVTDILRSAKGISKRLKWGAMNEVMLLSDDAKRGVLCRRFEAGNNTLILALFIQPEHVYWQATTRAIRDIKKAWTASHLS